MEGVFALPFPMALSTRGNDAPRFPTHRSTKGNDPHGCPTRRSTRGASARGRRAKPSRLRVFLFSLPSEQGVMELVQLPRYVEYPNGLNRSGTW